MFLAVMIAVIQVLPRILFHCTVVGAKSVVKLRLCNITIEWLRVMHEELCYNTSSLEKILVR